MTEFSIISECWSLEQFINFLYPIKTKVSTSSKCEELSFQNKQDFLPPNLVCLLLFPLPIHTFELELLTVAIWNLNVVYFSKTFTL